MPRGRAPCQSRGVCGVVAAVEAERALERVALFTEVLRVVVLGFSFVVGELRSLCPGGVAIWVLGFFGGLEGPGDVPHVVRESQTQVAADRLGEDADVLSAEDDERIPVRRGERWRRRCHRPRVGFGSRRACTR